MVDTGADLRMLEGEPLTSAHWLNFLGFLEPRSSLQKTVLRKSTSVPKRKRSFSVSFLGSEKPSLKRPPHRGIPH